MDRLDYEVNNLRNLTLKENLTYIYDRFGRALIIIEVNIIKIVNRFLHRFHMTFPHPRRYYFEFITERNKDAFTRYNPKTYEGRVVIFRSSIQPREIIPDPTLGWGELIEGDLELYEIPAYHQTILSEPQVNIMAEKLKIFLEKTNT